MRVTLDACVLYPTVLRQILIGIADAGLILPVWSARILEEWRRAEARNHPGEIGVATVEIACLTARFPAAIVPPDPELETRLSLPDENDLHVLATAITAGTDTLVTLNLRDFPGRSLARYNICPRHPDSLLLELLADHPKAVRTTVDKTLEPLLVDLGGGMTFRKLLKKASLPRLAKALI